MVSSVMYKYYFCVSLFHIPAVSQKCFGLRRTSFQGKSFFPLAVTEPVAADRSRGRDLHKHNTAAIIWLIPEVANVTCMLSCSC